MNIKRTEKDLGKTKMVSTRVPKRVIKEDDLVKFSPSWVVLNSKDVPGYKMELIGRIREGVKKTGWKQFIQYTGSTEKEFKYILRASINGMQKNCL